MKYEVEKRADDWVAWVSGHPEIQASGTTEGDALRKLHAITANYRTLDGCWNCVNMFNETDYDTGNQFVCLLMFPDGMDRQWKWKDDPYVDEYAICDEHEKEKEET